MFEPINIFNYPEPSDRFAGYDVTDVADIAAKVRAVYNERQSPDVDPMLNFDERSLLTMAEEAGFSEVHLHFEVDLATPKSLPWFSSWESFLNAAGNPLAPTLAEAMETALSRDEVERFTNHLKPLVEAGRGVSRNACAYLWAVR